MDEQNDIGIFNTIALVVFIGIILLGVIVFSLDEFREAQAELLSEKDLPDYCDGRNEDIYNAELDSYITIVDCHTQRVLINDTVQRGVYQCFVKTNGLFKKPEFIKCTETQMVGEK